jgi:hypothetical protein
MSEASGGGRRRVGIMAQSKSALLEARFWPSARGRDIWMIVDSARDPKIFSLVLGSYLEYSCLYSGVLPAPLGIAAPYLMHLEYGDRRCRHFLEQAWGNSWGIFLKCDISLKILRRHLRGFLKVRDANGNKLLFRYYDPRVLRLYLPSCSSEELQTIFGPIERIWTEGETADTMLEFGFDGNRLVGDAFPLDAAATHPTRSVQPGTERHMPDMLTIRASQFSLFSQAQIQKFEDWMVAHLGKFFPHQCSSMGEAKLRETVQYGIKRAAAHGLTAKRDVCKYIDVMIALGPDFDTDARFPWAPRILRQSTPTGARTRSLLQAAVGHLRRS